jgi:hypothetical protein
MGQGEKVRDCLERKLQILEKIAAKTETLCRFTRDRKLKALNRVLEEREILIQSLTEVNRELADTPAWQSIPGITALLEAANNKQQAVLERSRQVLAQAREASAHIAAELKSCRVQKQIRSHYTNPWTVMLPGRRINEKG